ncbi:MAG: single-stranded DNA-binding protein [Erysipelotrichaceae bacterium]|jgi:single-strand DNA-binding protein|nr:single-stranded DNA-binding protein [Erysipelotrichaceae bacterium]
MNISHRSETGLDMMYFAKKLKILQNAGIGGGTDAMMNGFYLVGTVKEVPSTAAGKDSSCTMTIQSDRMFRNEDGSLDEDIFTVEVWRGIAEEVRDCCEEGMIIAVKGRMASVADAEGKGKCQLIAEHVTYPHRRNVITKNRRNMVR